MYALIVLAICLEFEKANVKTQCSLKIGHLITFVHMAKQGEITDTVK